VTAGADAGESGISVETASTDVKEPVPTRMSFRLGMSREREEQVG
jgi:hypothetical protein